MGLCLAEEQVYVGRGFVTKIGVVTHPGTNDAGRCLTSR